METTLTPLQTRLHIRFLLLSFILIPLFIPGCGHRIADRDARIARVAHEYIATHFPDWPAPEPGWKPEVLDKGTCWEFRYALPPNTLGGGPVVLVEKDTLKVLRAYHEQ